MRGLGVGFEEEGRREENVSKKELKQEI